MRDFLHNQAAKQLTGTSERLTLGLVLLMIDGPFVGKSDGGEVTGAGVGASVSFVQSLDLLSYSQFGVILHASLSRLGHSRFSGLSHNPLPLG